MAIDTNADFTPSIPDSGVVPTKLPYNPTGSFKFWAQKVIPLVYDDSLSYYEVLCKVVTYLNNVIQNVDNLNDSVDSTNANFETLQTYVNTTKDELISTYNELQDYVNTYFDNLDVQEEINEKLDAMAESGELTTLISPFVPDVVTSWLNTHVNPVGSAVIVDDSLSISGAAADAKVTGDFKSEITEQTRNLITGYLPDKSIESNGTYWSTPTTDVYYAPVVENKNYTISTNDLSGLVCAFYTAEPKTSGTSYDSSRIVQDSKTITAPITGYIAFRVQAGYEYAQITEGTVASEYIPPLSAKDVIARENIDEHTAYINTLGQSKIIEKYDFTGATSGHFINSEGVYSENEAYSVSEPIALSENQTIIFVGRGYSTYISMIAEYSDGNYIPLVLSIDSTDRTYTYKADHDMMVVISYRTENVHDCTLIYDIENMSNDTSILEKNVFDREEIDFSDSTEGYFITDSGNISDNPNYSYSKPFFAKYGDTIVAKVSGYLTYIGVIAEKTRSGYSVCVTSVDSTEREYRYKVMNTGMYVISYRNQSAYSGYIENNVLENIRDWENLPYVRMFRNMAGIGDSLMSGATFKGNDGYDCKNYSWLAYLARETGAKWYCFSQGGYTTKDWLDGGYKTEFESLEDLPDCVFIAFGTNDRNNQATIPKGNPSDSAGTQSFCGYYKQIINIVHTTAPGAAIFCCSLYDNYDASSIEYSTMICSISDQYNYCYFIDIANASKISRKVTGIYAEGDHFTTPGYLYISQLIKSMLNGCIRKNIDNFKYLSYDNTEN